MRLARQNIQYRIVCEEDLNASLADCGPVLIESKDSLSADETKSLAEGLPPSTAVVVNGTAPITLKISSPSNPSSTKLATPGVLTTISLLSVIAPDQIGLLWAICAWLAEHDVTIDAMRVESAAMMAHDAFIVKGTFVASDLAGRLSAAHELAEAILVNPHDREGMAEAIWQGLEMPLGERRERWSAMMATLRRNDAHAWRRRFIETLAAGEAAG